MPNLNFVLPHWLYWGGLIVFPLVAMYLVARQKKRGEPREASHFIAYLFLVTGGLFGLHRLYLRNLVGLLYIPLILGILFANDVIRDRREDVSRTRSAYENAHRQAERLRPNPGVEITPPVAERLKAADAKANETKATLDQATAERDRSEFYAHALALLLAAFLILDVFLLPGLVRRAKERDRAVLGQAVAPAAVPDVAPIGTSEDPTMGLSTRFTDAIENLNKYVGEYVAYWAMIAVFVYYYEVIARYVFNSPTNWVHESMFLMFGMQYMLSGAYAYREDQHVRVDVFYSRFSPRGKAIADIITSVFFFIFILTMVVTGWRFAADAVGNHEVSFTEWGVQYWVVKLSLPIGAALLALQGLARLIKDIVFVARGA